MKKHLLLAWITLAYFSFVRDTHANDTLTITHPVVATKSPAPDYTLPTEPVIAKKRFLSLRKKSSDTQLARRNAARSNEKPPQTGELLFSNDKISISNVYPNPSSASASINYVLAENTDAKIILYDVLANVIGEYPLTQDMHKITISTLDLTSGVYFYTLSVEGKSVVTRKLIVKHS